MAEEVKTRVLEMDRIELEEPGYRLGAGQDSHGRNRRWLCQLTGGPHDRWPNLRLLEHTNRV